ncbi:MAG TPA: class I SAM-dependent methyltransferase [Bryobacteraceae bacterium]|jgi:SAM-dependent methyltransferase
MDQDPTRRFSVRVDAYVRYRPSYPAEVAALAERECGLRAGQAVADIGCGTGLLARLFLEHGCDVFGVEPNPEMRNAGLKALAGQARFHSVDGRAEATTLASASVDLITAGQAAHWFDADSARAEFRRILKPAGWLMLVWNERKREPGFMNEYESLIARHAPEHPRIDASRISRLFGKDGWHMVWIDHHQTLDAEGLRGRVASSSYTPLPGTGEFGALMAQVDDLFARHQREGWVNVVYDTEVYYGRLAAS